MRARSGMRLVESGGRSGYRAARADWAAWESARRPKMCLLAKNRDLQRIVAVNLKQDWSPQQIAGWLRDQYPGNPGDVGVTRDDLPKPFRSGSRRSEERADWTPSLEEADPPIAACNRTRAAGAAGMVDILGCLTALHFKAREIASAGVRLAPVREATGAYDFFEGDDMHHQIKNLLWVGIGACTG
jgi:hypothetical protein